MGVLQLSKTTGGHIPVMTEEAIQALAVNPGGRYVDCTLGAGGHSKAILEHAFPGGQLLSIDADPAAIKLAGEKLAPWGKSVRLVNDNFHNLEAICRENNFYPVHGILLDLGLSSMQLNASGRGFSFQYDASLDMRFSPSQKITAADIVNTYSEKELDKILREYGEEWQSTRIARTIIKERPFKTTLELARAVERAYRGKRGKIHPATKTFQALRIAVNDELTTLKDVLKQAVDLLGYEGKLVVISYHSLEDRIVKQFMAREASDCICPPEAPACTCSHVKKLKLLNKKVITPSEDEIKHNPRSRSAKLRAAERVINGGGGKFFGSLPFLSAETD